MKNIRVLTLMPTVPDTEYIHKCTSACAGCSSDLILRHVLKAAGPDTVLVVPACCTSVLQGVYPNTSFGIPVYNVAFASAAAVASGMAAAFEELGKNTNVIAYAGDGGTVDIGIQALSGALERGTNFLYICYDNEAYGNTGMQRSGSTPLGARTTTTPGGKPHQKKDLDRIIAAHHLPYMATSCSAYPQDIVRKVEKALSIKGPKFLHILAPCPPGWRYDTAKTIEVGKLAVRSGMWAMYEREYDTLTLSGQTKAAMMKPAPLEEYLKIQGRFSGLKPDTIAEIRQSMERNLRLLKKEAEGTC
ncbi:MAG: thiamine pyrophosphate-dependent enzyme [Methanospirillum sp.]|uniref:thiamine pyrophosphate-dependent enzyme n=1 Tax=Methanospirillum sp. TaxID=45200 RepID=UPI002372A496|nr:thiamine pyrophosphate-dependent enzyme [Methanospirillum sp.]MDD1728896.1 thiamine pyrophosphate-dependent enzyme [Methanospirillum sp.]